MKTTSTTSVSSTLNRSIFFFYEKTLRYVLSSSCYVIGMVCTVSTTIHVR